MRRSALVALVALAGASVAGAGLPAGALAATVSPAHARLQGQFLMTGQVTDAVNVRGVHLGDVVKRTWTFTPGCAAGPCRTIVLVRQRGHGSDRVTLHRKSAGVYKGSSSFYAPLRCGSRVYNRGEVVPFTITVRITAAVLAGTTVVANKLKATYTNPSRSNQTPCVVTPAHDAAKYRGHLV